MDSLTAKQKKIFDFIESYLHENNFSPSLREIGKALKVSVGTIQDQVEAIVKKGFIKRDEIKARGFRMPIKPFQIPLLGRVHAGPLHAAIEDVEGYIPVAEKTSTQHHFALNIKGDSMIDAGIFDGDVVVVRSQSVARDGNIVVARIDDEATVKKFREKNGTAYLEAANPKYAPIRDDRMEVLGVVVEVRRQYKP
jgi:repressor LexA